MPLVIKVNAVDKSDQVEWRSFKLTSVLSKEPDICEFRLHLTATKTFKPVLNDEVTVELNAIRIFGGIVVETRENIEGQLKFFKVMCKDFTVLLDRFLVIRRFQNLSANAIIADIFQAPPAGFVDAGAGFTLTGVIAPNIINDINFNHYYVSDALQKLADYLGFEWFVDPNKDIKFFSQTASSAPFNLTEGTTDPDGGNFIWNSLQLSENIHQLRNKIIVRGGTVVGDSRTVSYDADGQQELFLVGQDHINMTVKKNTVTQTLGKEGIDDNDVSIATLYNPNSGYVRFKTVPTAGDTIAITSQPAFPLIKVFKDNESITKFGEFEFVIIDKTIKSDAAATSRARGELLKWADEIREARFRTRRDNLKVGQLIELQLPSRGVNRGYIINRITARAHTPIGVMMYEVTVLASETYGIIDVLTDLLINQPNIEISILEDEIINLVEGYLETVNQAESVFNTTVNPRPVPDFTEAVAYTGDINSVRINPFNPPIWVAGPTFPSPILTDTKRTPNTDANAQAT